MRHALLLTVLGGLLLTTTACDEGSDAGTVVGIPGDPPTVTLSGVPPTVETGIPIDFTATVTAPSGLRTTATFGVTITGSSPFSGTFDAADVPGCSGGDTFCSVTLSDVLGGNPLVITVPGTLTLTLTAFDVFNASGSDVATIVAE